jgi:hypothetical protein
MHSAMESYYGIGMGGDNKITNVKKVHGRQQRLAGMALADRLGA